MAKLVSFKPSTGGFLIRRELTDEERGLLEARAAELDDCLVPVSGKVEEDRVAVALIEMYGSFSSMRQGEQDAAARIESVRQFISGYPAWAIEKACGYIRLHGVQRGEARDKQWPPSDAELVAEIEEELKLRKSMLGQARALLEARVDDIDLRKVRAREAEEQRGR